MSKCEKFIEFFDSLLKDSDKTMPNEVKEFYEMLKSSQENFNTKPTFTEIGLLVLEFLQNYPNKSVKSREIADGLELPSRRVSGSMRKLVTDGFVEKFGQNPVIYALTEKGKNFNLTEYKENLNNAEND